ncbi:MAG: hypothetical protein KGI27_04955 [Thaumarchaeota archaeon]|nr:hypothetical protein [Nitrososphaerota archaeon]
MTQKHVKLNVTGDLSILIFGVTIGILLLSISQSFAFDAFVIHPTSTMTVHADKAFYKVGNIVTISGIVTGISPSYQHQEPSGKVGLLFYSDTNVFEKILVDVQSNGVYSYQFNATHAGTYQIFATYQDASAQGTFKVSSKSNEIPVVSTISIQTDKSTYVLGDKVEIRGKVTGIVPGLSISLVLVNEDAYKSYQSASVSLSSDGSYSYQYIPQERGKIDVVASYNYVAVPIEYIIK